VIAAADGADAIWRSLGIVEVTATVFWLAHVMLVNASFGLRVVSLKECVSH